MLGRVALDPDRGPRRHRIGITQNLVTGYASFADKVQGFNESVPYVLLFAGLILLDVDRAPVAPVGVRRGPPPGPDAGLGAWRRIIFWAIGLGALSLYLIVVANPFWLGITTKGLAFALVCLSFVIVTGIGGMVSLAQATFVTAAGAGHRLCIVKLRRAVPAGRGRRGVVAAVLGSSSRCPRCASVACRSPSPRWRWPSSATSCCSPGHGCRNGNERMAGPRPSLIRTDEALAVVVLRSSSSPSLVDPNVQRSATGRAIAAVRSARRRRRLLGRVAGRVETLLFATRR